MFCVIAPLLFIMESIILTGSSRIRPEDLFSSRVLLVVPQLSKGLQPWTLSNAAGRAASVTLLSLVEAVFCSVSAGSTLQLSCSTSVKSISLRDITTCQTEKVLLQPNLGAVSKAIFTFFNQVFIQDILDIHSIYKLHM